MIMTMMMTMIKIDDDDDDQIIYINCFIVIKLLVYIIMITIIYHDHF